MTITSPTKVRWSTTTTASIENNIIMNERKNTLSVNNSNNNKLIVTEFIEKTSESSTRADQFLRFVATMSEGALKILNEPNAGGNSLCSEVLSFEFMRRMYNAELEKTEMEIVYHSDSSKKVDYSMKIFGERMGVSVTRCFHYVDDELFTHKEVIRLLEKKLEGLTVATQNVIRRDRWEKQLLHIWVKSTQVANLITEVYENLASHLKKDSIVLLTIAPTISCIFDETANDQEQVFKSLGIKKPVYVHEYEDIAYGLEDFGSSMDQVMNVDIDTLMNGCEYDADMFSALENDELPAEDLVDFFSM
jgi:hypothetical protein